MAILSRRALLSAGGAAGAAGVLGVGAEAAQAAPPAHGTFTLHGSELRILGARGRLAVGDSVTIRGLVHASRTGGASARCSRPAPCSPPPARPNRSRPSRPTCSSLADGTLTGHGTVTHDGVGTFTVTGGSGRYAEAHGSYQSRQHADHSGGGSAEYTFVLR